MQTNWKKYNGAIIPSTPPHIDIKESREEIKKIVKKHNSLFARWISDFDCKRQMSFWYIINDQMMKINDYSTNTRNQIKKGFKNFQIKKIDKSAIIDYGYDIYSKAFKSYKTHLRLKPKKIFCKELEGKWEFWGIFYKNTLIGYSQNKVEDGCCEYSTIKIDPDYQKMYPSYALIFEMNTYYLNERKLNYVSDGTRSIAHHTDIQEFLIKKFKFRKAFCRIHVLYSTKIKILVEFLFPFRNVILKINLNLFQKVGIVLKQEEIIREQMNE
tara:strand:- start:235 stop:1044 length:810 start_codon:yes stop_codon:yes gene_type:complete